MKFPRNAKILRSHFDMAPFATVFFVLVIFLLLGALIPTPGIQLQPPSVGDLPGIDRPAINMAVDARTQFYFENQIVTERQLRTSLAAAVRGAPEPLTLVIHADKSVSYELLARLALLARQPEAGNARLGITNILLATLPQATGNPAQP